MTNSASYWKNIIGDFYMSLPSVRGIYSLTDADLANGFDATFSTVSFESILFYAIGFVIYTFELTMDAFRVEIQTKIDGSYIANKDWWHAQSMAFQKGYDLVINPKTFIWSYSIIDTSAQIIKRVAVRESATNETPCKVKLYVASDNNVTISKLSDSDLNLFNAYVQRIKPSGVLVDCFSLVGDTITFTITANYNPLLIDSTGTLISGTNKPVEDAVNTFIDTLNDTNFGGKLNLTKLIDAIQLAEGVIDARVTGFTQNTAAKETWGTFDSVSGWFVIGGITVNYQPQNEL